jgi:hypothetical protein
LLWNQCSTIDLTVGGAGNDQLKMVTGKDEMLAAFEDNKDVTLNMTTDQFIVRDLNDKLACELCIRLKNGHVSTEREATEWEKRNEAAKEAYMRNFLKESGLTMNRKQEKKIQPNAKCPCASGKKYKKCCMNKVKLTGVADGVKDVKATQTDVTDKQHKKK